MTAAVATSKKRKDVYELVKLTDPNRYIRLLQIKGSLADVYSNKIECILSSHSLSEAPPYRCLSYVWGVQTHNSDIEANGDHKVSVTKNLRGFLERMRAGSRDPKGYLWIDAICINQDDEDEREAQVAMMGAIYAKATQVIAWLGWEYDKLGDGSDNGTNEDAETLYAELNPPGPLVPTGFNNKADGDAKTQTSSNNEADNANGEVQHQKDTNMDQNLPTAAGTTGNKKEDPTEAAIDFIRVLYPAFKNWTDQGNSPWSPEFGSHAFGAPEMFEMLGIQRIGTKRWAALAHFLNRQWFHRTWIVQEAALASSLVLVCGLQVLLWDQIVKTCIFLQASGWFHGLMDFLGPEDHATGPGWRGIVFASMQDIYKLNDVSPELGNILPSPLRGLDPSERQTGDLEYDMLLFYLITSRPFEAGDKRDKVYAPLALLSQVREKFSGEPQLQMKVRYKDEEVMQVYIGAAALIIQKARTLLLLSQVEVRASASIGKLPSWVPDFSQRAHSALLDIPGLSYDALPNTVCDCIYSKTTNEIDLEGFAYDEITSFGPDFETELFKHKDWRPWINHCLKVGAQYTAINGETYVESLWRTLIGDFDGTTCPASLTTAACFKRYIQICTIMYLEKTFEFYERTYTAWHEWSCLDELRELDARHHNAIPSVQELQEFAEEWRSITTEEMAFRSANPGVISTNPRQFELKTMRGPMEIYGLAIGRLYAGRRFFRSRKGWMGLAPISAVEGDRIWFLAGGKTPFVLRPYVKSDENVFELVGECYMHGLMHGDILKREKKPEFRRIALA